MTDRVLEDGPGPSSSKWRTKLSFNQNLPPSAILAKVQQVHHKDPHHVEGTLRDRWGLDTSFSFLFYLIYYQEMMTIAHRSEGPLMVIIV